MGARACVRVGAIMRAQGLRVSNTWKIQNRKGKTMDGLGKSVAGGRSTSEFSDLESRPKRRREDRGKGRAGAGSEDTTPCGGLEGQVANLQAQVEAQSGRLDFLQVDKSAEGRCDKEQDTLTTGGQTMRVRH